MKINGFLPGIQVAPSWSPHNVIPVILPPAFFVLMISVNKSYKYLAWTSSDVFVTSNSVIWMTSPVFGFTLRILDFPLLPAAETPLPVLSINMSP